MASRTHRPLGILLFLPVPVVLFLFTQAPLGAVASLGLGVVLMVTHRLYARPWALARAGVRCLWCGGPADGGPAFTVREPFGATRWTACREPHRDSVVRFLAWADARRGWLKAGILGTLGLFLPAAVLAGLGRLGPVAYADVASAFRLGIAVTVLPLGLLGARGYAAPETPESPFPVHVPALIGTAAVSWLFRIVGIVWLVQAVAHFARGA